MISVIIDHSRGNTMNTLDPTNSPIVARFRERTVRSRHLIADARQVFPSGIVHDSRHMAPYPIYVERAQGGRKWDVDGNEYVDFYGGHGALLLGHAHPALTEAVNRQITLGTHPAACHELELEWGRRVQGLIPSAERLRFTASGTEANLMAIRLARAFTGHNKLVRLRGHFHGWQDHVAFGVKDHFDGTAGPGIVQGIAENVILAPAGDIDALQIIFEADRTGDDEIAAVILEPTGASSGQVPLDSRFARSLRALTERFGILLIFDEVVTGFRVSPSGAQGLWGIEPDLTTLAKILAGGLPGGAVSGRRDILEHIDFEAALEKGFEKIGHHGTFNANPLSAAAGIAMLDIVAETDACQRAAEQGRKLRNGWNHAFADHGVSWAAYGFTSSTYLFTNPDGIDLDPAAFDAHAMAPQVMERAAAHPAAVKLRLALMIEGVDISGKMGAITSAAHGDDDIDDAVAAMGRALEAVRAEGDL